MNLEAEFDVVVDTILFDCCGVIVFRFTFFSDNVMLLLLSHRTITPRSPTITGRQNQIFFFDIIKIKRFLSDEEYSKIVSSITFSPLAIYPDIRISLPQTFSTDSAKVALSRTTIGYHYFFSFISRLTIQKHGT